MKEITIITGSPGTGKTSLAAYLADAAERGVHVVTDHFHHFIAHRLDPATPPAHGQNVTVVRAFMRAANAFAEAGYEVYVDGIVGPWMLPVVREECRYPLHYAVLRADLDTTLRRIGARRGQPSARRELVGTMHSQFAELGTYEHNVIETTERPLSLVAADLVGRRARAELRI